MPRICSAAVPDFENDFDHIIDMALRVDAARNGQTDEVQLGIGAKHQRANFDRADSAFQVQLIGQRDARELVRAGCAAERRAHRDK